MRAEPTGHSYDALPPDARFVAPATPEDAARFAEALRSQLRAAQAQALGVGLDGASNRDRASAGGGLTALLEELQRGLLGLPGGSSDSPLARMLARYRGVDNGGARVVGFARGTGTADDPHGWRDLARTIGDNVVGEGFGDIFERQIDQESGFDPDVVYGRRLSSAGAEGIAQLMPQFYPNVNRLDPLESLTTAATTLSDYLRRYNGDVRMALAAYNAGPGRVGQLVATHGSNWEQGLPAETKRYLNNILGSARPRLAGGEVQDGVRASRATSGALRSPVAGELTQDYHEGHRALDVGAPTGTPIRASAAGRVVSVEKLDSGYGWHVVVDHGSGLQTLYAHASAIYVRPGDSVRKGEVIAAVGSTGKSTGPHLHFEVRRNGAAVDPRQYVA